MLNRARTTGQRTSQVKRHRVEGQNERKGRRELQVQARYLVSGFRTFFRRLVADLERSPNDFEIEP